MSTFFIVVRKHNKWSGKNRKRVFPENEYERALKHYNRLTQNNYIDRASLNLRCGLTQPFDEVPIWEHWK